MKPVTLITLSATGLFLIGTLEARIFTNNKGKKLDAEIISKTEQSVELKTPKGKTYNIKLNTLSAADQEYVRQWKDEAQAESALADIDLEKVMSAKGYTKVEFDEEMNHLFVDVKIEGKNARLLLDTGAMATIIKTASVEKFGLEMKAANAQAGGVGGNAQIRGRVDVEKFKLGGKESGEQTFYVMDLSHLPEGYASKMDGILGGDFFKSKKAMFDYSENALWLKLQ